MKTYADLDLKKIRDDCGLDFARHTYSRGQCSCCYGPTDMSAKWWAKGKKPKKINKKYDNKGNLRSHQWDRDIDKIPYILFKNADNGNGRIKSLDEPVKNYTCIEYYFTSDEQKNKVCQMLQEQLGAEYYVQIPRDEYHCIVLFLGEIYSILEAYEMLERNDERLKNRRWYYYDGEKRSMDEISPDALSVDSGYPYVISFHVR